ncbi:hypothetical protein UFOVP1620_34 [uncultured Caudovirales phage]|uniref:Uncharacterized protein n=1 Tax=uncultured Caudovirales phage TaxID=2100421 RepID=A0A6J5SZS2_9CAUD|nr:hypothetical protein UFOVP1620_34 [uncultured Caudovirales phage]
MQYAKINGDTILEFPSYPQRDHPNTSFGDGWTGGEIEGSTYVMVEIEDTPQTDYLTQDTEIEPPKKVKGQWVVKTKVKDISPEEKAKRKADRADRDKDQDDNFLTKAEIKQLRKLLKAQA